MTIQIELKSAVCGLLAGVAIMLCIGAGTSSNPTGKFQIMGASDGNGALFTVLDTQTGEVWGTDSAKNWSSDYDKWADFWKPK